jgi:hypothetical protein
MCSFYWQAFPTTFHIGRSTILGCRHSVAGIISFKWNSGGSFGTAATNRPIVPAPSVYDAGEIGGMVGRRNRSTRRKPASETLCPPQIPHAARTRTRAAAVGSQRRTARVTAQPSRYSNWLRAGRPRGRSSRPGKVKNFLFSTLFQTVSGVHPTFYPMGTGDSFPGYKAAGTWSWPLTSNYIRKKRKSIYPLLFTPSWRS